MLLRRSRYTLTSLHLEPLTVVTLWPRLKLPEQSKQMSHIVSFCLQAIYERIFHWIITCINTKASANLPDGMPSTAVSVLDVYGFEIFGMNRYPLVLISRKNCVWLLTVSFVIVLTATVLNSSVLTTAMRNCNISLLNWF